MHAAGNLILTLNKYNNDLFYYLFIEKADEDVEQYIFSLGAKIKVYDFEMNYDFDTKPWHPINSMRLFAPYFIEDDIEKILYMDTDMFCKGNLDALFSINMGDCIIAMVPSSFSSVKSSPIFDDSYADAYCNAGTTLLNIKKYKSANSYESFFEAFKNVVGKLIFLDQDFLNYLFRGKIYFISQRYNVTVHNFIYHPGYKSIIENAKIIHLTSKPWKIKCKYRTQKMFLKYSIDKTIKGKVRTALVMGIILKILLSPFTLMYYILFQIYQPLKKIGAIRTLKEFFFKR